MDHFPVFLSLSLSQRETHAIGKIQSALAGYPKDRLRFRSEKNLYCHSLEFRCYFADPAEIEVFARHALEGCDLVRSPCLGGEEKRCPASLNQEAQLAMQYREREVEALGRGR